MTEKEQIAPDSMVFFNLPRPDLDNNGYRAWIDRELLTHWLVITEGNKAYSCFDVGGWNEEGGVSGNFQGEYFDHCKLYKLDQEGWGVAERASGVLIRDHYSPYDVEKVYKISASLEAFLNQMKINYSRHNYPRRG